VSGQQPVAHREQAQKRNILFLSRRFRHGLLPTLSPIALRCVRTTTTTTTQQNQKPTNNEPQQHKQQTNNNEQQTTTNITTNSTANSKHKTTTTHPPTHQPTAISNPLCRKCYVCWSTRKDGASSQMRLRSRYCTSRRTVAFIGMTHNGKVFRLEDSCLSITASPSHIGQSFMASRLLGDYGYLVTGQPRLGREEAGAAMFQPTTVRWQWLLAILQLTRHSRCSRVTCSSTAVLLKMAPRNSACLTSRVIWRCRFCLRVWTKHSCPQRGWSQTERSRLSFMS
jgi:hypothetical protein